MTTTSNDVKMTRADKRAAERAAAAAAEFSRKVAQFKASFLADQARRIYSEKAVWDDDTRDKVGRVLYSMMEEFKRQREGLEREMASCVEALREMQARVTAGADPMYWSNGIVGRYGVDIDQYATQLSATRKAVARVADLGGWRVREIETVPDRARWDEFAGIGIVVTSDDLRLVYQSQKNANGDSTYLQADGTFGQVPVYYRTEELAWAALHVYVTGRTL